MIFAAPLWLIALVPLAAVVVYLLWGRRRQEAVPFLDLWVGPVKGPRPKRRFAAPPVPLALAILAMLLAILGAARPALWDARQGAPLTIIIDRGATMVGFADLAQAVQEELAGLSPSTPVDLRVVPGAMPGRTDLAGWLSRVTPLSQTAVDTTDLLRASVARALAESSGPVIVVGNRPLEPSDDRVVQVTPRRPVSNVGVIAVAARESPHRQVMVRVRNDNVTTRLDPLTLRVTSAGRKVLRQIDAGRPRETHDHFIDLPALGDVVKVELGFNDHFRGDNDAWLVREGSTPRVEARGTLPAELRRMIEVYAAGSPPTADSPRIVVAPDGAALPPGSAGVVVPGGRETVAEAEAEVRPHAVTKDTRWAFGEPVRLAPPPPAEWTAVVSIGGRPAVAVREAPARQVWVGIESDEWPRTPEYVVFWANVFDWLGGAEVRFASYPVGRLEGAWSPVEVAGQPPGATVDEPGLWPGLYRRGEDGALRAVNAGDVRFEERSGQDWKKPLARALDRRARGGARPVSSAVLLAAGACAALAAALWKRGPRRNPALT